MRFTSRINQFALALLLGLVCMTMTAPVAQARFYGYGGGRFYGYRGGFYGHFGYGYGPRFYGYGPGYYGYRYPPFYGRAYSGYYAYPAVPPAVYAPPFVYGP